MTAEPVGDVPTNDNPRRYARRRTPFGGHVAATAAQLQQRYRRQEAAAGAVMAQLRAAVDKTPGSDYAVLAVTSVPDTYQDPWMGDEPTDAEHAKHTALTLFALHQQSIRDAPMHVDGRTVGAAIASLPERPEEVEAVRRRFVALGTATTYEETLFHLRSLVRQLRDKRIPLDYGLLADDIVTLRRAGGPDRIRSRWGRDFYRTPPRADQPSTEEQP